MKKLNLIIASVFMMCILFAFSKVNVLAEDDYTYTVTFYSGNQGVFQGSQGLVVSSAGGATINASAEKIVVSGLRQGDYVGFDVQQGAVALLDGSKYYVKGVRLSGRDNDTVSSSAFYVDGDADYVVAYGMRGNIVDYTIQYQTESGQELAPSRTYFGNIGDKPVVAYLYIENYIPQALALTKTLSANVLENVFTFVYTSTSGSTITEEQEGTQGTTGMAGTTGTSDGTSEAVLTDIIPSNDGNTEDGVQELIELEDEEVPLAESGDSESLEKSTPMLSLILIAVLAILGLGIMLIFIKKNRKENG